MRFRNSFLLLALLTTACERAAVHEFLGCTWDVSGLTERGDGSFGYVTLDPLNERNFSIQFHSEIFEERVLGDGYFDLVEVLNPGSGLEIQRYVVTDKVPLDDLDYSVILRQGESGYVGVLGRHYQDLLVECRQST